MEGSKEDVRDYWDQSPCDAEDWASRSLTAEYFDGIARHRYATHPYIPAFAEFERWKGLRVLEIGVGAGCDFCRWIQAGADAVGIDLTPNGVKLTLANLASHGLKGPVLRADAESLPFADEQFDLCYSFGVIHHTPRTEKAVHEIRRVLKPGGQIRIMLYHLESWVTLRSYLEHGLFRGDVFASPRRVLSAHKESPGTKAYRREEVLALCQDFVRVRVQPRLTTYDLWDDVRHPSFSRKVAHWLWPRWLVRSVGDRLGWNLLISGTRR